MMTHPIEGDSTESSGSAGAAAHATTERSCEPYWVRLYLSGPIEVAKQAIRADCLREGLCVTVEPTDFIYTGGEESGYIVGLVNYPRFPSTAEALLERARHLMRLLLDATHQHSALLMTPERAEWITKRPQT